MRIFELLDQYEGICRRFFFGCSAKLNKTFKANLIEILILIMGRTPKDKLSSARTLRMVHPECIRTESQKHDVLRMVSARLEKTQRQFA